MGIFILISVFALNACRVSPDLEKERKKLLTIHENQRKAHFEKDVSLLLADGTQDFIEVNRGSAKKPSREESIKRFQAYFDAVDFIKWDDVKPPIFFFSEDATMATAVVEKLVITKQKLSGNKLDTAYYTWLSVYKKNNGKWQMAQIASTNK